MMSAFSPRQMFLLDQACKPIREAFINEKGSGFTGLYLVGTAVERQAYRDVDVRLMLADKRYDRLAKVIGHSGITFLGLVIGQHLATQTGLPIDFQVQRTSDANEMHQGARNPLGLRTLTNYQGDGRKPVVP